MRIRFFNAYDTAAPFFRNLVPHLATAGNEVEVVMSKAEYRSGDDLEKAVAQLAGARIVRAFNLGIEPRSNIAKFWVMLIYSFHAAIYSLFGPSVDRNVFLTQPPILSLWGYILSKVRRQPYFCVVMDIYPEMAVELGMMRYDAVWTRLWAWLFTFTLRKAQRVIVIGRCMAKRVAEMDVAPDRIVYIPNWADERSIVPVLPEDNQLRRDNGWQDKLIVLYAGNIGMPQYFDDILTVAEQLKDRNEILFCFIGTGSRKDVLQQRVEKRQLTNVVMLPFLHEQYTLADILSAGDVHFISLWSEITGLAVPSKTYTVLAAGRPFIYQGSADGEIAHMILEENIGWWVAPGDVEGLKNAILKYANNANLRVEHGQMARALVETRYSRQRALQQYADVLLNGK